MLKKQQVVIGLLKELPLLFLSACLWGACTSQERPIGIPEFSIVLPDTTQVFNSKDIPYGKTTLIIWFDPACRDCQEETEYILANMQKFAHTNIYMMTRHPYEELMVFYNRLKLDTCKNIRIGMDKKATIPKALRINSTPITLVYNQDKMLKAVFKGKPKPEQLVEIINKKL